jgi:protein-S-isoprenylcysteine O-methyltransferase Ste14
MVVSIVMSPWLPVSFVTAGEAIWFSVAFYGWVASEIIGSMIVPRIRQYLSGANLERKDRGSGWAVITGVIASIFVAFYFSSEQIAMLPSWTFYPGIALMIGGILLRQWSIAILGRYFSMLVSVQEGQSIIREGPYRFVRHPSYTGALLTLAGIGLAVQSWGALLILLLIFGIVYGYRIHVEEKALVTQTGEKYVAYMKETKMLIPFIF